MVTHQLQVKRRPGKVRRSKTDVLPLSYIDQLRRRSNSSSSSSSFFLLLLLLLNPYFSDDIIEWHYTPSNVYTASNK